MARKKEKLHGKAKIASRSAAAKKAWETRRKKYGKSGVGKSRKPRSKRKSIKEFTKKDISRIKKNLRSRKVGGSRSKSRGRMRIYSEGGGHVTVPR